MVSQELSSLLVFAASYPLFFLQLGANNDILVPEIKGLKLGIWERIWATDL